MKCCVARPVTVIADRREPKYSQWQLEGIVPLCSLLEVPSWFLWLHDRPSYTTLYVGDLVIRRNGVMRGARHTAISLAWPFQQCVRPDIRTQAIVRAVPRGLQSYSLVISPAAFILPCDHILARGMTPCNVSPKHVH